MTKEWVEVKEAERLASIEKLKESIRKKITEAGFNEEETALLLKDVDESSRMGFSSMMLLEGSQEIKMRLREDEYKEFYEKWHSAQVSTQEEMSQLRRRGYSFERFCDSDPVEFDGDIIITDPCYILIHDGHMDNDWERCDCGYRLDELGIQHFMTRDTIYGDWSCSVFDTDTRQKIGDFCADAGMVSVIALDEVLKYNPGYRDYVDKEWTCTCISDFKGTVQFVIHEFEFKYENETQVDYEVEVVGHGTNKKTGAPINFSSRQTGF